MPINSSSGRGGSMYGSSNNFQIRIAKKDTSCDKCSDKISKGELHSWNPQNNLLNHKECSIYPDSFMWKQRKRGLITKNGKRFRLR